MKRPEDQQYFTPQIFSFLTHGPGREQQPPVVNDASGRLRRVRPHAGAAVDW